MATVRESDTLLWLHNKLGADDTWSTGNIASLLTADVLRNARHLLPDLDNRVKLKLLVSLIDIRPRAMEEMKSEVVKLIEQMANEQEPWIQLVAEILRPLPNEKRLDSNPNFPHFDDVLATLRHTLESGNVSNLLPLESPYLNKKVLESLMGKLDAPKSHFQLRKRTKSEILKAELLQKSLDVSQTRKHGALSASFPVRSRLLRQQSESAAGATSSSSSLPKKVPTTPVLPVRRSTFTSLSNRPPSSKKESKIQLIDVSEAPMGPKKRRRPAESTADSTPKRMEPFKAAAISSRASSFASRKSKDVASDDVNRPPATPHYAIGLTSSSPPSSPASQSLPSAAAAAAPPTYALVSAPSALEVPSYVPKPVAMVTAGGTPGTPVFTIATSGLTTSGPPKVVAVERGGERGLPSKGALPSLPPPLARSKLSQPPLPSKAAAAVTAPAAATQPSQKKELRLTREQLTMAQEMFKNANKVNREEKAMILEFMAGSRQNPSGNQGDVVTVLLNQNEERVKTGTAEQRIIIEILFEMNYKTGQWRRLQRKRIMQLANPSV
ncbi:negative elongation factor A-like [Oscarella lobularis]|uniref:negative elongation factor A-like n=1 Tax=Oscarella lobularis TaxID=121494 RepID=UPI003314061F